MDRRTKRQKLEDMANQTISPNEAEIAKKKLEELPLDTAPLFPSFRLFINGVEIEVESNSSFGFTYHYDEY